MSKFELSLVSDYVASWTIVDAVRELFQNGLDQEAKDPTKEFSWRFDDGVLTLRNLATELSTSTLLLGSTSKGPDDPDTVGQFGEGYKLAALVLVRNNKKMVIHTAREVWRPRFVKSRRYGGAEVLTFFTERASARSEDLVIKVHGITQEEWTEQIAPTNLLISPNYRTVSSTQYGDILDLPGKVFVNGLYVCDFKPYKYGYNFKPGQIRLDRDRKLVSDFDLQWMASVMWSASEDPDAVADLLHDNASDVRFIADMYTPNGLSSHVHQRFLNKYGDTAVPVSDQNEAERVPTGYKPVILNETHKRMITKSTRYEGPALSEVPTIKTRLEDWLDEYSDQLSAAAEIDLQAIIDDV